MKGMKQPGTKFGQMLRSARLAHQPPLSQGEAGALIGRQAGTISSWERQGLNEETIMPDMISAMRLMRYLRPVELRDDEPSDAAVLHALFEIVKFMAKDPENMDAMENVLANAS